MIMKLKKTGTPISRNQKDILGCCRYKMNHTRTRQPMKILTFDKLLYILVDVEKRYPLTYKKSK